MSEPDISKVIEKFQKELPKFDDGRINYTHAAVAPVVTVFVQQGDEILLLKRSDKVNSYQGKWNNVGGYLDENKPLRQKALEELQEELGIDQKLIQTVHFIEPEILEDSKIGKTWIKYSGKATLISKPEIKLDFEHTEFKWVHPNSLAEYDTVPGLAETWQKVNAIHKNYMKELWVRVRNFKIKILYKYFLKQIFFLRDPEKVHDAMTAVGMKLGSSGFGRWVSRLMFYYEHPALEQTVAGIHFKNPIGLAAGFDKNAQLTQILPEVGFGFEEVGSITGEYCPGNEGTRLWRLKKSKSLMVYYGLKNDGCIAIAGRLKDLKFKIPIGISVAKTNSPKTVDEQAGIDDYVKAYKIFVEAGIGDYFTINISCPNAFGGEPFNDPGKLDRLLTALRTIISPKPVLLKLQAELPFTQIDEIIEVSRKHGITGFICTNLAKDRSNKNIKDENVPDKGGMSGKVVQELSDNLIKYIYQKTGKEFVIIGCGGVFSAEDAYRKIKNGASLIQMITGMIFEGPEVVSSINQGLVKLLHKDGFSTLSEAVGSNRK